MRVKLRLRTGDKAILAGAAAIAVYELVVDDDDLITRRCQAYRSTPVGRILFDTWLIVTAMHLVDAVGVFRCGSSALSPC